MRERERKEKTWARGCRALRPFAFLIQAFHHTRLLSRLFANWVGGWVMTRLGRKVDCTLYLQALYLALCSDVHTVDDVGVQ